MDGLPTQPNNIGFPLSNLSKPFSNTGVQLHRTPLRYCKKEEGKERAIESGLGIYFIVFNFQFRSVIPLLLPDGFPFTTSNCFQF
jgi:hypothetical protein